MKLKKLKLDQNMDNIIKELSLVKDEKRHINMLKNNTTHKLRKVDSKYFENIRAIQKELMRRAKKHKWRILDRS